MKNLLAPLAVLGLLACDTDVTQDYTIPYTERLVLESFISPQDTLIEVRVMKTAPSIGKVDRSDVNSRILPDARVELSNGSRTVTLPFAVLPIRQPNGLPSVNGYFLDARQFPIEAGQTYTLRVSTPAGLRAEARCTIPAQNLTPAEVEFTRDTVLVDGRERPTFSMRVRDQPGQPNYYTLTGWRTQVFNNDPRNTFRYGFLANYLTDAGRDGEWLNAGRYTIYRDSSPSTSPETFELYLATTDAAYYEYYTTVEKQRDAQGNPFAEPQPVYSNVSGGLGVFAGYQWVKLPYNP